MTRDYSVEVYKKLKEKISGADLHRPMHIGRYEAGAELAYDVIGMNGGNRAQVRLKIEKFVGGGFAGQVYRVKVLHIKPELKPIEGLKIGGIYAIKILIPPTAFSQLFRNTLYRIGFQGPFQLQVNPAAARAGALWQKFIRRGAKIQFGDERTVVDIYATFVDTRLGSCGELSEWIEGRTWRLEIDDHMDLLSRWKKSREVTNTNPGSPEYRAKYEFMDKFVDLMHKMGCPEFARQYEWTTCKSQPNCLKRKDGEGASSSGLVAVDFRAGLALLPFLPMSPGDFKLIVKGLGRGSLVQFDRGNIGRLEQFIDEHKNEFSDMSPLLEELKEAERVYRDSVPDITHNRFRLFYSSQLWSTMLTSAVTGWQVQNLIDEPCREKLHNNKALTLLFLMIGAIPFLGRLIRKLYGRADWRKHYLGMLTSWQYLGRALRAKITERIIDWHRSGRVDDEHALKAAEQMWPFLYHLPLSILPVGAHRFITDWRYAKEQFHYLAIRPVLLYFNPELREQWLREMVTEGKKKNLLSDEDAKVIISQVDEPFIQKYLKALAVHVCTLPVTQIVSVLVAIIYVFMHPEMPRAHAWGIGLGIIALFQVVPISPGSLVRGLYVVYLVIKERNFKDFNIAVFLGFFKYIGYLAFPIQMAYHYPTLARFMAGHWATEATHIVPVFGERGALLEHGVFCLFYNWPLTIRRRMHKRAQIRTTIRPRYWPILFWALAGAWIFRLIDLVYLKNSGQLPGLMQIWYLAALIPVLFGAAVTLSAGGTSLGKRIISAACCGGLIGIFYTAVLTIMSYSAPIGLNEIAMGCVWRVFVFALFSTMGAILMELRLPEPRPNQDLEESKKLKDGTDPSLP